VFTEKLKNQYQLPASAGSRHQEWMFRKRRTERTVVEVPNENVAVISRKPKSKRPTEIKQTAIDQTDVLSSDFGYQDVDDQDTAKHIEQTQNLLRSIRNVQLNDSDQDIDVKLRQSTLATFAE
jgi:hypothetical protein